MSTSRAMSAIPPEELPILESLINIRVRLTALKKKSEHIRPADVQDIYKAVIKQVTKLNAVRDERNASNASSSSSSAASSSNASMSTAQTASPSQINSSQLPSDGEATPPPPKQNHNADAEVSAALTSSNRVDTTLNDVFALLSLFFLTIGRGREAPATFSQLGCMHQLLDHLAESGIYTEADLKPFATRLSELRGIITRDTQAQGTKHPPQLTKLMMRQLEGCEKVLSSLQGTLSVLSAELLPLHNKLVSVRRQLSAAAAKPKPQRAEIKQLQEELRKIDNKRVDGKFLGPGGSSVPAGQAIVVGLLEESFEICHDVMVRNRNDEVPGNLQPIYERLLDIKGQLENLVLTHRWTLRETDLWNYQISLKEIDRMRVNGKFVDSEGKTPEGQLVLLYLLRRCYGLIYRLIASSEPISEELLPISNKLSTVSKCLREISKFSGTFTMRDLYPYKLALHQIDNLRQTVKVKDQEGREVEVRKWLGRDGSVPEGQGILKAQYEEVEQTIEEMLGREEEEDTDEDDDDEAEGEEAAWDGSAASADVSSTSELSSSEEDDDDTASVTNSAVSGAAWGTPDLVGRDEAAVRSVAAWNARQATVRPGAPGELGAAAPPPASPAQVAVANPFGIPTATASLDTSLAPLSLNPLPGRSSPTASAFQHPSPTQGASTSTPATPDTATTAKFSGVQDRAGSKSTLVQGEEHATPTAARSSDNVAPTVPQDESGSRTITPGLMRASSRSSKARSPLPLIGEHNSTGSGSSSVASGSQSPSRLASTSPLPASTEPHLGAASPAISSPTPTAPAPTPLATVAPPTLAAGAGSSDTSSPPTTSFAYAHASVEPLSTRLARDPNDPEGAGLL